MQKVDIVDSLLGSTKASQSRACMPVVVVLQSICEDTLFRELDMTFHLQVREQIAAHT